MSSESRYRKGNDDYGTPSWIKDGLFRGWFDPCPLSNGAVTFDGLNTEWIGDRIFVNPPYSQPLPWVEKAITEYKKGKTIALLLKHDSSTVWWAKLHEARAHFLPVMGRLQFATSKSRSQMAAAPFPSVLVILSPIDKEAINP